MTMNKTAKMEFIPSQQQNQGANFSGATQGNRQAPQLSGVDVQNMNQNPQIPLRLIEVLNGPPLQFVNGMYTTFPISL